MKRLPAVVGVMLAALSAAGAMAQSEPAAPVQPAVPVAPSGSPYDPRGGRMMGPPPGRPMMPAREAAFAGRPHQAYPGYPMERMTPEERRQLRQDIHQHGRELYRGRQGFDK